MRAALFVALAACAAPPPAEHAPPPPQPVAATATPPAVEPRPDAACEGVRFPAIHAMVHVDEKLVARALAPVVHAVCACTRRGDRVQVRTSMTPSKGTITAHVSGDDARDRCVQNTLDGRYEPFPLGSDCIGCGSDAASLTFPFTFEHAAP